MPLTMVFSTLWGIALKECGGTGGRTRALIAFGLALLVASTVVVGYGSYLGGRP